MVSLVGQTLSHYTILEHLGSGGMGVVYKAQDLKLDRTVALKFLPPDLTRDPEAKQRFIHEAKAASALQHNNICTVHDIDETPDGQLFIVMDFYEGETLKEKIEHGPLTILDAVDIAIQVSQGLARAHEHGIVHRDIKPANIMVTADGVSKIVDFGLAKLSGQSRLTKTGSTLGTAAYMSPEQARGEEVDQRTDIWSLGVILYEMLSGHLPFRSEHDAALIYSILNEDPKPIDQIRSDVPQQLSNTLRKALEKSPSERYGLATDLLNDLTQIKSTFLQPTAVHGGLPGFVRRVRRQSILIPLIGVVIVIAGALAWYVNRIENIRWAEGEAMSEIKRLAEEALLNGDQTKYQDPFKLACEVEKVIPHDSALSKLWPTFSRRMTISTDPPGAKAYRREYSSGVGDWEYVGITPLDSIRIPKCFFRWRFEKAGFDTLWAVSLTQDSLSRKLDTLGRMPRGMLRVSGGKTMELQVDKELVALSEFLIDKFEVTNAQFKGFVEAGGYRNRTYWKHAFTRDGKKLSWEEAMLLCVDATGRPGPSTWQAGDYPEAQEDYPVSGVSWYEAAAYAEFSGKDLPTTHHWGLGADFGTSQQMFLTQIGNLSNFGSPGPSRVGAFEGMNAFGAYDMAGNVREWCLNESKGGRCVRGGTWNDISYMYEFLSQAPAFDRSPKNGFRCVRYLAREKIPDRVFGPVDWTTRDYAKSKPVSDAIFQLYTDQFSYDRLELNPVVEKRDESLPDMIREKVTFDAAYAKERVIALLFLPRKAATPYQTIIFFPGSYALWVPTSDKLTDERLIDFIVKSGRAVVYPVYYGTYERNEIGVNFDMHWPSKKYQNAYTELLIKYVKDFGRTIDYLSTRKDIDTSKLAFYGFSWGARLGCLIPAVDRRLKASVLLLGGFAADASLRPEADEFNYAPRVHIPTLMLNGKYDVIFPCEIAVEPMYEHLGTAPGQKRLLLYDTDHFVPLKEVIKETLAWYDLYLGPVN